MKYVVNTHERPTNGRRARKKHAARQRTRRDFRDALVDKEKEGRKRRRETAKSEMEGSAKRKGGERERTLCRTVARRQCKEKFRRQRLESKRDDSTATRKERERMESKGGRKKNHDDHRSETGSTRRQGKEGSREGLRCARESHRERNPFRGKFLVDAQHTAHLCKLIFCVPPPSSPPSSYTLCHATSPCHTIVSHRRTATPRKLRSEGEAPPAISFY